MWFFLAAAISRGPQKAKTKAAKIYSAQLSSAQAMPIVETLKGTRTIHAKFLCSAASDQPKDVFIIAKRFS